MLFMFAATDMLLHTLESIGRTEATVALLFACQRALPRGLGVVSSMT